VFGRQGAVRHTYFFERVPRARQVEGSSTMILDRGPVIVEARLLHGHL
jgi:hypothetical protein